MTTLPDLEPAGLDACPFCKSTDIEMTFDMGDRGWCVQCDGCGSIGPTKPTEAEASASWNRRAARSTAPEAGKAGGFADDILFELVEKVENRIAYRISLGSTPRAIAEDVLQIALASVPEPAIPCHHCGASVISTRSPQAVPAEDVAGLVERLTERANTMNGATLVGGSIVRAVGCYGLTDRELDRLAAAALTASEAEATSMRRKLEEESRKRPSYREVQEIVNNSVSWMQKAGESHAMLARHISEALDRAIIPTAPLPEDTHHGR